MVLKKKHAVIENCDFGVQNVIWGMPAHNNVADLLPGVVFHGCFPGNAISVVQKSDDHC